MMSFPSRKTTPRAALGAVLAWGILLYGASTGAQTAPSSEPDPPDIAIQEAAPSASVPAEPSAAVPPAPTAREETERVSFSGLITRSREFQTAYPVSAAASVTLSNRYGPIRVDSWDQPVVQVSATFTAGGESAEGAEQILEGIRADVRSDENGVSVQTVYPDSQGQGMTAFEAAYRVTVPKGASLKVVNLFGDTSVEGMGGTTTIEEGFGALELKDLAGPVHVRTKGDFPLRVTGLCKGGSFQLRDTQAEFREINGEIHIRSFMGSVLLERLAAEAQVDATVENGPIYVNLGPDSLPYIEATAEFGKIESEVTLQHDEQAFTRHAWNDQMDSPQRLSLHTTFDNIVIRRTSSTGPGAAASPRNDGAIPIMDVVTRAKWVTEGTEIVIEALPGDVRVEGFDEDEVQITATRWVRLECPENARAAFDALALEMEDAAGRLIVRTAALQDMAGLGCASYRVDLDIRCPRTSPVTVRAQHGQTRISDIGGAATVVQSEGTVTVEHAKGALDLHNDLGDVQVSECAGPLKAETKHGDLSVRNLYGDVAASTGDGKMVLDMCRAAVTARSAGGDVRILALEGISGNYDVLVEQGNVSMVLPSEPDATLLITAHSGMVYSAIPLTGTTQKDSQRFQARLGNGLHLVTLEAKGGDVIVD